MKKNIILLFQVVIITAAGQVPGGVGGVNLWLKADSEKTTQLQYTDYSNTFHEILAASTTNKPKYQLLNYNESLDFDGTDDYLKIPYLMENLNKVSIFTAYQNKDIKNENALFTTDNSGEKVLYYGTANIFRYNNQQVNYIEPNKLDNAASFSMYSKFDIPSKNINQIIGNSGKSTLYVGKDIRQNGWKSFQGLLPEFFIYTKVLTHNERDRINSYLAVKYGITMPYTEYLSSKSKKIWLKEDYKDFPNNIAGIARDNHSGLFQKQAASTSDNKRLIIAAKQLASDNKKNTSDFQDQTFLVWGNDNKALELDKENFGSQLLKRNWKTRLYSEQKNTVTTEVIFSIKDIINNIPADKKLYLFIDREGKGKYDNLGVETISANTVDKEGNASFKNIIFDKDLSGTDVFTFGLASSLLILHDLLQPTCLVQSGSLSLNIKGGKAPFAINLRGNNGSLQTLTTNEPKVSFANLPVGSYSLNITDANQIKENYTFNINDFNGLDLDLGGNQQLTAGNYIEIDASKNITDPEATYQWISDKGFSSNDPKIKIYEAGEYNVTVTTKDGCSKTDKIHITNSIDSGIVIYPNPTHTGDYFTIKIKLDHPEKVNINIYDMAGRLIKSRTDSAKSLYELKETINTQGTYVVMVTTDTQNKTFKLIIN